MKLLLCDLNSSICEEWKEAFRYYLEVEVVHNDFCRLELKAETNYGLVAAGNSFGIMGGGIDLAIARHFPGLEQKVQDDIKFYCNGELNVGDATSVLIKDAPFGFTRLIYTPTMRVPMRINATDNVYRAFRAALSTWNMYADSIHNDILVVPGLGGACGRMSPKSVARSMELAYRWYKDQRHPININEAHEMHKQIIRAACYP